MKFQVKNAVNTTRGQQTVLQMTKIEIQGFRDLKDISPTELVKTLSQELIEMVILRR